MARKITTLGRCRFRGSGEKRGSNVKNPLSVLCASWRRVPKAHPPPWAHRFPPRNLQNSGEFVPSVQVWRPGRSGLFHPILPGEQRRIACQAVQKQPLVGPRPASNIRFDSNRTRARQGLYPGHRFLSFVRRYPTSMRHVTFPLKVLGPFRGWRPSAAESRAIGGVAWGPGQACPLRRPFNRSGIGSVRRRVLRRIQSPGATKLHRLRRFAMRRNPSGHPAGS